MEIALQGLNLHRGGRLILQDVSWHVRSGERWLVIGASGAGKTQLLKVVAADVWPDDSQAVVRRYRLGADWHEHPVDVRDEMAWLGPERQDRYERYGWNQSAIDVVGTGLHRTDIPLHRLSPADQRRCRALLQAAGIARLAARGFLTLSYGERRLVLLARALAWRPALLLMDEVATGLDAANRARLQRLLGSRRFRPEAWICSAHRSEDIPRGATHLLWLAAGRVEFAGKLTASRLRLALSAARAGSAPGRRRARVLSSRKATPAVVGLQDANIWMDGKHVLHDITLTIRRGECWVLHGANGSGKSTLLRTIYGDHSVASGGQITRAGVVPGVGLDAFRGRTGLVAPHLQTDYPRQCTVLDTVVSGLHSSLGLNFRATPAENRKALLALRALGMEGFAARTLAEMSYGQVRRILFARAQVVRPRLLLLDEAFTGVDASLRADLMAWLEGRIAAGVTVVMATHYRSEWPRNASHELMLSRGRITYAGGLRR